MNTARNCLLLAATLLLAACASTSGTSLASQSDMRVDAAYVNAVERVANERGVRVVWVNPPQKRKDK